MKIFQTETLKADSAKEEVFNLKMKGKNEKTQGFGNKVSKMHIGWKKITQHFVVKVRLTRTLTNCNFLEVHIGRDEVFKMASRYLPKMSDEQLVEAIHKARDLPPT